MSAILNFFILMAFSLGNYGISFIFLGGLAVMYLSLSTNNTKSDKPKNKFLQNNYLKAVSGFLIVIAIIAVSSFQLRGLNDVTGRNQTQNQAEEEALTNSQNAKNYLISQDKPNLPQFEKRWYQHLIQTQNQYIAKYQYNLKFNPYYQD